MVLTFRKEQLAIFERQAELRFVDTALFHLRSTLPETCEELGESAVIDSIEKAIQKSKGYGFETEKLVLDYINLMYWLGFDFDEDPDYPWVQETLQNTSLEPENRMEWLTETALETLDAEEQADDAR